MLIYCGLKFEKKVQFRDAVFPQRLKPNLNAAVYPMSKQNIRLKNKNIILYIHTLQFTEVKANLLTALFTYFFPIFYDINAHIGGMLFQEESIY